MVNKFHIAIASGTQASILYYHFKTGKDLGSGVTNTVYAFYVFLAGHALTYQKWPDADYSAGSTPELGGGH